MKILHEDRNRRNGLIEWMGCYVSLAPGRVQGNQQRLDIRTPFHSRMPSSFVRDRRTPHCKDCSTSGKGELGPLAPSLTARGTPAVSWQDSPKARREPD